MDNLEQKIIALESKVENIGDKLTDGFELILARLDSIDNRISDLKGNAKGNLGAVEGAVNDGFKKVIEELKKINHVTRYEDMHDNLPSSLGKA
ncbi:hypothetical protein ACM55F_09915 [Flavobacterium sp. XS2P12]|uniref:hypothetical protein n=1 Tax=Flavobacterium melibiosi TaxID=3398734 RepID=UPI003A8844B7